VLLVPVVIVAARIWLGTFWGLWAVAILAALAARREVTRLYLRPMPPALREALADAPRQGTEALRELARRHGAGGAAILYWPADRPPEGLLAAYYVIQGRPLFLLGERLPELLRPEEVRSAFAHELAHHVLGHVKRSAAAAGAAEALAGAAACLAAGWMPPPTGAGWPLAAQAAEVLLIWAGARLCLQVALNALERRQELQADRKAVQITGDRGAHESACRKLAAWRGAEKEPPRWTHWLLSGMPTLRQRLAAAGRQEAPP
jgi:Zn-dependent protease with chaperone function